MTAASHNRTCSHVTKISERLLAENSHTIGTRPIRRTPRNAQNPTSTVNNVRGVSEAPNSEPNTKRLGAHSRALSTTIVGAFRNVRRETRPVPPSEHGAVDRCRYDHQQRQLAPTSTDRTVGDHVVDQ